MLNKSIIVSITPEASDLSLLAIEVWRLEKKITKVESALGNDNSRSIHASLDKIKTYLDKNKIEVTDFSGLKYNDGLNVDVLSFSDEKREQPIISETIEPMIRYNGKVAKRAKVIVTK